MPNLCRSQAIAATLLLGASLGAQVPASTSIDATLRKPADRAVITLGEAKTVVTVSSPSGIGGMILERKADRWPAALTLRLNLRGLESIKIAAGGVNLAGSYSSHGDPPMWAIISTDGKKEDAINRSSPYWTDIRARDGYFEIDVPAALLGNQTRTLSVDWIDFYR